MRDVKIMTNEELSKELDAFYEFVRIFGYGYFTEEGLIYFNHLRGEYCIRVQAGELTLSATH